MKRFAASVLTATLIAAGARTETPARPFQFSVVPDFAICDQTEDVTGLALNIWGSNQEHALAIGLINGSFGQSGGLAFGFVNYTANFNGGQAGLLNVATDAYNGGQVGFVNYAQNTLSGVQCGLLNYAGRLDGFQVGFVNMAPPMEAGLQVGFLNLIVENRQWFGGLPNELAPAMVFVNWKF